MGNERMSTTRLLYPKEAPRSVRKTLSLPALANLGDRVTHVPRRNELALLDVHRATGLSSGDEQISLAAEERGNLQDVGDFRNALHVDGLMHVGEHRNMNCVRDLAQDAQSLADPGAAETLDRRAVRLIVRSLEDVRDFQRARNAIDALRHLERVLFALNDTRTGDQEQLTAADLNVADLERQFHVSSFSFRVGCPFHIRET